MNNKQIKWLIGGGSSLIVISIIVAVIVVNVNSPTSSTSDTTKTVTFDNYSSVNNQSDSATNSYT